MSRIVRFHEFGGPDVLKVEELPDQTPGKAEVRIKVCAIGLNRAEVVFREGKYLERPAHLPSRVGYEAAGTVDAVGEGVTNFKLGDKVSTIPAFSMSQYGVYGESAIVPTSAVSHFPDHLSFEEGASIWMQYLTAYGALIGYSQIKSGDFVMVTAASSSVGYAAIELINASGATAIATTRTSEKKQKLIDAGAAHVIVTDEEDLVQRVDAITSGRGVNVIFDPVAGPFVKKLAEAAAPGAVIYEYGALSGAETPFPLFQALQKGLSVRGYSMFELTKDPAKLAVAQKYVFNALKERKLKPLIDKTFKLDQIADAHRYMESNQQNGKIVVTV